MATLRQIRKRIRSVQNIQRVTRAMKMVAVAELQRAQANVKAARPYAEELQRVIGILSQDLTDYGHPLLEEREPNRYLVIVLSGDRGLCGAFNANVIRAATRRLKELPDDTPLLCIGTRGADFLERRGYHIFEAHRGIMTHLRFEDARSIADTLAHQYTHAEVDRVEVIYSEFRSMLEQVPRVETLLPIPKPEGAAAADTWGYIYEPSRAFALDQLLPRQVEMQLWRMMLESSASEQAARMHAMDNATKNAKEMIDDLILERNRVRQTMITKEIAEIVGGAEALKSS